jgi:hypothetical protein
MFISQQTRIAGVLAALSFAASGGAALGTSSAAYACNRGICGGLKTVTARVAIHKPALPLTHARCPGGNCGQRSS